MPRSMPLRDKWALKLGSSKSRSTPSLVCSGVWIVQIMRIKNNPRSAKMCPSVILHHFPGVKLQAVDNGPLRLSCKRTGKTSFSKTSIQRLPISCFRPAHVTEPDPRIDQGWVLGVHTSVHRSLCSWTASTNQFTYILFQEICDVSNFSEEHSQ